MQGRGGEKLEGGESPLAPSHTIALGPVRLLLALEKPEHGPRQELRGCPAGRVAASIPALLQLQDPHVALETGDFAAA